MQNGGSDEEGDEGHPAIGNPATEKPVIKPGESYEYSSFCPLNSDFGFMSGFYTMRDDEGEAFKADIPQCGLISSNTIN